MMKKIDNVNVEGFIPLISPRELVDMYPSSEKVDETVINARNTIQRILSREDKRLLVISGPCSIHDENSSLDLRAPARC